MGRASSGGGSKPGYTGHNIPDWSKSTIWGKGTPGIQGKGRGRSHILDARTRNAPPVGADVTPSKRSRKAPSSVSPFNGGTL